MRKALACILAVLATACSTRSVLTTEPTRAEVYIDGRRVASRTPYSIRDSRSIFATGERTITIRKEGYQDEQIVLQQVVDGQCIGTTLAYSVGGALLLIVPILGVFYLPWCSRFEDQSLFVELQPLTDVGAQPAVDPVTEP